MFALWWDVGRKAWRCPGGAFSPDNFFKIWIRSNAICRIQEPTSKCFSLTVSIHFRVWWSSECDGAFRSGNRTAGRTLYSFRILLACVASASVGLVLPARKMVREPKRGKRGRGRGRKETLADKPLDFENRLLDLSCLSAHTKISCCRRLSELSRTCQDMSKTTSSRNGEISINPSDQCSFWNWNFKIKFNPSKSKNFKVVKFNHLIF